MNKLRTLSRENKFATLLTAFIVLAGIIYGICWGFRHISWYGSFVQSTIAYFFICAVSGLMYFLFYIGGMLLIIWGILELIKKYFNHHWHLPALFSNL